MAGIVCGIVLGRNKLLSGVFSLYIQIASSIPRVGPDSVFVIALGLGMASKVAIVLAADYLLTSLKRRLLKWKPATF